MSSSSGVAAEVEALHAALLVSIDRYRCTVGSSLAACRHLLRVDAEAVSNKRAFSSMDDADIKKY